MKVNVKKTEIIQSVDELPNGKYGGFWSGYEVRIDMDDNTIYKLVIDKGVRTLNMPCIITKTDEGVDIE